MADFEKQSVDDAINTLKAKQGDAQSVPEYAAAAHKAQIYAQAQAEAQAAGAANGAQEAAFNANGAPDAQNVTVDGAEQAAAQEQAELPETEEVDDVDINDSEEDLNAELSELRGQIEILKQTVASEHDKMIRAVAEAENVRKRAAQEVERERKYSLEKFARALLPVYDALEKALEYSDRSNPATKDTIEGVENTLTLFLKEIAVFGVETIDPTGQPFDPNFHQALSLATVPNVPNNQVIQTVQKGFTLNGRVLRAAMVIVSKAP